MVPNPVIVTGTTPDYIARIHGRHTESALFLVDACHQGSPMLKDVDPAALVYAPLENPGDAMGILDSFLALHRLSPRGVACFDCESLLLASRLASRLGLPFPPVDAIIRSRNKFESRRRWHNHGVPCPSASLVSSLDETHAFFAEVGNLVLKPVSGSGSELLFHCRNSREVHEGAATLERELPRRKNNPLFRPVGGADGEILDPCRVWIAEEYVPGPEFSCDFLLQDRRVKILRTIAKERHPSQPFGSVRAYLFPAVFPGELSLANLSDQLGRAAAALGFTWGHFMVDFVVREGLAVFLEMTPRPGGDSIPDLVETATGCDLLDLHLDFVSGSMPAGSFPLCSRPHASINLYAPCTGTIEALDLSRILSLPRVEKVFLRKTIGDSVTLPPEDYDNRLLGYCIVRLEQPDGVESLCRSVEESLVVSIHPDPCFHKSLPALSGAAA